ncbi:MAG TPA: hypothetical protein VK629_12845 [Steroidobacteraceae bacterium]|nr:hypothetical protein [Steroidobacteraceae bacterium]
MTQVSTSAAYKRKQNLSDQPSMRASELRGSVFEEQVWALLETPQTIESLQRAASKYGDGRETHADSAYIERMLERLLDADLIELAPDS